MAKSRHPLYRAIELLISPRTLEGRQILVNNLLIQYPSYFDGLKFYLLEKEDIHWLHQLDSYTSPGEKAKKIFWKDAKKIIEANVPLYLTDPSSSVREFGKMVATHKDKK